MTRNMTRFNAALVGCAMAWYTLLISGYDLGQLIFGLLVLVSDVAAADDVQRALAFAGTAALTMIPVQAGGALGLIGAGALLLRQRWAVWVLLCASACLCWPVLVWIVIFAVWRVMDGLGAALLLAQILITAIIVVMMPILGWLGRAPVTAPAQAR